MRSFRISKFVSLLYLILKKEITALLDHEAGGQKQKETLTEVRFANNKFLLWGLIF